MFTTILSLILGVGTAVSLKYTDVSSSFWSIFLGILVFVGVTVCINLILRKKISQIMYGLQMMLTEGQKTIQNRVNQFQSRPNGDPKRFMAEMEKKQHELIKSAIDYTKNFEKFRNWTPLFGKQINTTRMQFYYQLQDFAMVDKLLPKCLYMEQMTCAMRIARMYKNEVPLSEIEKQFKKFTIRLRRGKSYLLYSLMAWIFVQKEMLDKAHIILVEGCKVGSHDTMKKNLERLANNRIREFSNAGLGDEWFALFLEAPKMQIKRQQHPGKFGKPF
jgi:hypothetical protein